MLVCEDRVIVVEVAFVVTWSIAMEFGESRAANGNASTFCCALAPKFPTNDSTPTNSRRSMHSCCERCNQDSHVLSCIRPNL